ncbi:chloride channel protein [Bifidobacterium choloepi]|uniref:Voltage-gated chloride channel n=1 Tax=Bifidobacterium choloepi TaxID=2614131 RepID=A0A6I5MYK8_9BIFI|nr:chloride channel protein [Bifidobacterium choloepi]NEG69286.1 voltage-gated chloride channel [Bifidobacterium choloepi]
MTTDGQDVHDSHDGPAAKVGAGCRRGASCQRGAHGPEGRKFVWRQLLQHLLFALVCGVVCGFGSVLLCICVDASRRLFVRWTWLLWLLPVLGVLELLLYRWWKLPQDTTTESVVRTMRRGERLSGMLAPGILLTTCMTMLGGGAVGKEAGALQMGASLGTTVSKPFHLHDLFQRDDDDTKAVNSYVASTGMAAEFSALFFAPLGSAVLVIELLGFSQIRFIFSILIACFAAYAVASMCHIGDIITAIGAPPVSWPVIGNCIVIGVAGALFGAIFATSVRMIQGLTKRIFPKLYLWVVVAGLFYAVLVIACKWIDFTGSGGELLNMTLETGNISWDFAIKMLLVVICLGFWFKGGEIMPSLCIGGLLGSSCSIMTGTDPLFGAAIGTMCFFAAVERVPAAAFLMGCEIFGWSMAPFLAIAVVVAFMFSYPVGIYGAGADLFVRTRWRAFKSRIFERSLSDEWSSDRGPLDNIAQMTRALENLRAGNHPDEGHPNPADHDD